MDKQWSSIAEEQNLPQQLERLAAQRQLYSDAKRILVVQAVLVGIYPIIATIIGAALPDTKATLGLMGVIISLADATLIDPYQSACKRDASKIQELFDCTLFKLPWPEFKLGAKPTVETIVRAASRYKKTDQNYAALRDWYPVSVSRVPLEYARVICQRINTWWDSTQRRTYANYLFAIVIVVVIVLVVIGLIAGSTLASFFTTLATVSPLFIWGIREFKRQNDSCSNTDRLRQKIEDWYVPHPKDKEISYDGRQDGQGKTTLYPRVQGRGCSVGRARRQINACCCGRFGHS